MLSMKINLPWLKSVRMPNFITIRQCEHKNYPEKITGEEQHP